MLGLQLPSIVGLDDQPFPWAGWLYPATRPLGARWTVRAPLWLVTCKHLCHDQITCFLFQKGDGHQSITQMDLYPHLKDNQYEIDDHNPHTMFWPWHIWLDHVGPRFSWTVDTVKARAIPVLSTNTTPIYRMYNPIERDSSLTNFDGCISNLNTTCLCNNLKSCLQKIDPRNQKVHHQK